MNISEARNKANLTQEQVAGYLGISRVTYGKMERDPELITLGDAKILASLFGVDIEDIFFDSDCNKTYSSNSPKTIS